MSTFNAPLGINLTKDDPIIRSPFVVGFDTGNTSPPPTDTFMITEGGDFMLTEGGDFMITE